MSNEKSELFEQVASQVNLHRDGINSGERYTVNLLDVWFKFRKVMTQADYEKWKSQHFPNYEPYINMGEVK